jgi:hypothetical protein
VGSVKYFAIRKSSPALMWVSVNRHVDPVLPEEAIHFLLPAADTVGIPAGQPQDFNPRRPSRPYCQTGLHKEQRF